LAASFPGYYTTAVVHVELCQEHCLRIISHQTDDLKKRITDTIMTTHADMFFRAWKKFEYRQNLVRATKSTGNEVLKNSKNLTSDSKVHVPSSICLIKVMS